MKRINEEAERKKDGEIFSSVGYRTLQIIVQQWTIFTFHNCDNFWKFQIFSKELLLLLTVCMVNIPFIIHCIISISFNSWINWNKFECNMSKLMRFLIAGPRIQLMMWYNVNDLLYPIGKLFALPMNGTV